LLVNLHVKNFAIIDEVDVDFGDHLNIMTGETGAGKSILVGSISIVLGARVSPEMIGKHGDYAMVEAVFQIESKATLEKIRELDIEPEENQLVISRKITANRSVNKINGESVPVSTIRKVAALCIDIHGQHEHQSLLNTERHKEIVDEYGGEECSRLKEEIAALFHQYTKQKKELAENDMSAEERTRQLSFWQYEKNEIESAALRQGEMEELEEEYRHVSNAGNIVETLSEVHRLSTETAANAVSHGLRRLQEIRSLDSSLDAFAEELLQIEDLLGDFNREVSGYMTDFTFDEGELVEMERRLDCIHTLQSKYGDTYEDIMGHLQTVEEKLDKYADFEAYQKKQKEEFEKISRQLAKKCEVLSSYRKKTAGNLEQQISSALQDLNFAHVDFAIEVKERENFGADGKDEVEFMIATNPGEPRRSLGKVASGGELSRIMLAIKSVFADSDDIETLIFDEIDTGISGRTAQKVSEKMSLLGAKHQIICITHLAQIAAMADKHFVIEKEVTEDTSSTRIRPLNRQETEEELARLLGGVEITDAVRENAREMKEMADGLK
jgi:DNA repair protein RecN (Recombination protein N)